MIVFAITIQMSMEYNLVQRPKLSTKWTVQVSNYLNFSISPGLVSHWLSCFKVLHYDDMPPHIHWRNREKRNDQEQHEKANFVKMSLSLPMLLVMLFVHIGKRWNSYSMMFFKIGVLKNFAIFTGKHMVRVSF